MQFLKYLKSRLFLRLLKFKYILLCLSLPFIKCKILSICYLDIWFHAVHIENTKIFEVVILNSIIDNI